MIQQQYKFKVTQTSILPLNQLENNIGQIEGLPANPRSIQKDKYEKLKDSLTQHPELLEQSPLKVFQLSDKRFVIIGGNMRKKALLELGYKEVPCAVLDPTTTTDTLKFITIVDNSSFGQWDWDAITSSWDVEQIQQWGVDLPVDFNVDIDEDDKEVEEDDFTDDDAEQAPAISKLGDVYLLGTHRLMCGDSTKGEDVEKLMSGKKAVLLLTDPPYNVDYQSKVQKLAKLRVSNQNKARKDTVIANDKMSDEQFFNFLSQAFTNAYHALTDNASFYCWYGFWFTVQFIQALESCGLQCKQQIVWYKNNFVFGRQDYQWKHEGCLYGWKGVNHYFIDDHTNTTLWDDSVDYKAMNKSELLRVIREFEERSEPATTVWKENIPTHSDIHPTMKPIKLFARSVVNNSHKDDIVLDLFAGSGTTIMACEQLHRTAFCMEYEPRYCDAIIARWEKLTGQKAVKVE